MSRPAQVASRKSVKEVGFVAAMRPPNTIDIKINVPKKYFWFFIF